MITNPVRLQLLEAREFLEKLYLGPEATYEIHFPKSLLSQLDKMFDGIIRKHGLRQVQFIYTFTEEPRLSLKGPKEIWIRRSHSNAA